MMRSDSDDEKSTELSRGRKIINSCAKKKYFPYYGVFLGYGLLVGIIYAICAGISTETTFYRWISPSIPNQIVSNGDINLITEFVDGINCYQKAVQNPNCLCAFRQYDRNLNSTCKLYNNACIYSTSLPIDGFITIYEKVVYKTAHVYPTNDYFN